MWYLRHDKHGWYVSNDIPKFLGWETFQYKDFWVAIDILRKLRKEESESVS
jgi:hypothetical protein